MQLNKSEERMYTVAITLAINESEIFFFKEILRKTSTMMLTRVIGLKYPFLTINQANELMKAIKELPDGE